MESFELNEKEWQRFQFAIENAVLGVWQADLSYRLIPASTHPIVFPDWQRVQDDATRVLSALEKVAAWLIHDPRNARIFAGLSSLELQAARNANNQGLATARLDMFFEGDELWIIEANTTIPAMQAYSDMVRSALFAACKVKETAELQSNSQDLLDSLLDHYAASGGPKTSPRIGIIARPLDSQMAELLWLQRKWFDAGYETEIYTPDELTLEKDQLWGGGSPIDLCYRHIFAHRLSPGSAFAEACLDAFRYRVFNPISAHLEAKAVLAELSRVAANDSLSKEAGLVADEREAVLRRVLWSRILHAEATETPDGKRCSDFVLWLKKNREAVVIKSNLGYGGRGVVVGDHFEEESTQERLREIMKRSSAATWEEFVDFCLHDPQSLWIAQRKIHGRRMTHTFLSGGQKRQAETYIDASVFSASGPVRKPKGGACRFSRDLIVNIGQGGGLVPVLSEFELKTLQRNKSQG